MLLKQEYIDKIWNYTCGELESVWMSFVPINVTGMYLWPRDLGGSDPERMAAPRVEEYVTQCFAGTKVYSTPILYFKCESHCCSQRSALKFRKGRSSLRGNTPVLLRSIAVPARFANKFSLISLRNNMKTFNKITYWNLKVPRHDGRVIWLTYKPEGTVKKTVYLVSETTGI